MEIPNRVPIALLLFSIAVAALLWGFDIVPWWAIPIVLLLAPVAACLVLALLFYAAWIASGSH